MASSITLYKPSKRLVVCNIEVNLEIHKDEIDLVRKALSANIIRDYLYNGTMVVWCIIWKRWAPSFRRSFKDLCLLSLSHITYQFTVKGPFFSLYPAVVPLPNFTNKIICAAKLKHFGSRLKYYSKHRTSNRSSGNKNFSCVEWCHQRPAKRVWGGETDGHAVDVDSILHY